jgi:hypothetical protein
MAPFLEGKSIGSHPKEKKAQRERELMILRTKRQARVRGMVELKDAIHFK